MGFTKIVASSDGESYFEDVDLPASSAATEQVIASQPCDSWEISQSPPNEMSAFAPTRAEKLLIVTDGVLEMVVSNGDVRRFGPGDIVNVTDLTGRGHSKRLLGQPITRVLAVTLS